ncbi:MAG: transglutaminase domain-containing protein [Actinobacteria bacterium]|nr:transglutaminase domain-containing protein [Actinomycetota bacterium]MCL5072080.1 transglutaminase domain-containing protein [Actinomycetota bacterium]
MKKFKILKIIFIYVVITILTLFLTASMTSCRPINYIVDRLNEFHNKTTDTSYGTDANNVRDSNAADTSNSTTSSATDNSSVTPDDSSTETLDPGALNPDDSNTGTSSGTGKTAKGKKINFVMEYYFDILGDTSKIDFITIIPNNYEDRQEVLSVDYSTSPTRIFTDGLNKYAEFLISKPLSDFKLKITTELEIYKYDLERAMILNKDQTAEDNFSKYLMEEKYIEVNNPIIQNLDPVHTFTEDPLDHVETNYDFVMKNLDYFGYNPGDIGAVQALKNKGGDCTDYTDTFVTLCRASGFPARSIEGYPIDAGDLAMGHNWSEVFISDYGWVPFDPTYDDNNGSSQDTTFENLKNTYIYMSFIRNDATLYNYHYYYYSYWGDNLKVDKKIYIGMN